MLMAKPSPHLRIAQSQLSRSAPILQSQRDCVLQPRVARNELPWVTRLRCSNPERVASVPQVEFTNKQVGAISLTLRVLLTQLSQPQGAATLSGLCRSSSFSQGSSFLATLGFVPES